MDILETLNQYAFLGQEFLTWLWRAADTENGAELGDGKWVDLLLGDRIVLGPAQGLEGARITVKGPESAMSEAKAHLLRGKWLEALRLGMEIDGEEYWLTLRSADLAISSLKLPATAPDDDAGPEGLILERVALIENVYDAVEQLFSSFLRLRLAGGGVPFRDLMRSWAEGEEEEDASAA